MEKGTSKDVKRIFRMLDIDEKNNIREFCSACLSREYSVFDNPEMALMYCDSGSYNSEVRDIFSNFP